MVASIKALGVFGLRNRTGLPKSLPGLSLRLVLFFIYFLYSIDIFLFARMLTVGGTRLKFQPKTL